MRDLSLFHFGTIIVDYMCNQAQLKLTTGGIYRLVSKNYHDKCTAIFFLSAEVIYANGWLRYLYIVFVSSYVDEWPDIYHSRWHAHANVKNLYLYCSQPNSQPIV
jgi:hypothetical protein